MKLSEGKWFKQRERQAQRPWDRTMAEGRCGWISMREKSGSGVVQITKALTRFYSDGARSL